MTPIFSIIIPIYNAEQFLTDCVESVTNQSFENYELILVDDGSTDSCPHICDALAAENNHICVVHKENGGVASARNAGMDVANGQYVMFIDADDWLGENALNILNEHIDKKKDDIVVCSRYIGISDSGDDEVVVFSEAQIKELQNLDYYHIRVSCQNLSSMCFSIYKRDFLNNNKIRVNENYSLGEDTDFFFRALVQSDSISVCDCLIFKYRDNKSSLSHSYNYDNLKSILCVCAERIHDLEKNSPVTISLNKAYEFFALKFLRFGIKISKIKDKEQKKELYKICRDNKDIYKYVSGFPDRIVYYASRISGDCAVAVLKMLNTIVDVRNNIRQG